MFAPVLTSPPTPTSPAPGRAGMTLGNTAANITTAPIQGFNALFGAAQSSALPVTQPPAVATTQPPLQTAVHPTGQATVDAPPRITLPHTPPLTSPSNPVQNPIESLVQNTSQATARNGPQITPEGILQASPSPAPDASIPPDTGLPVLAPETPIEATADASETSDIPMPPETSEAPAPNLTGMALPLAVPIAPQPTTPPPTLASPAPTATTPATFTENATAPDSAPAMASDTALPDLGAAVRTGEAVTALALPQPAISAAPVSALLPQPLDLSAQHWPEQMVQDIRQSGLGSTDSLTLTLTPERLGTLHIRLEMQDGLTHVHIVTETPEAARALAEAQPRLAEAMTRAGLEMGNQSTGTSGGNGTTGGDTSPRDGGQPAPDADTLPPNHPEANNISQTPAPRHTSLSSIDLIA